MSRVIWWYYCGNELDGKTLTTLASPFRAHRPRISCLVAIETEYLNPRETVPRACRPGPLPPRSRPRTLYPSFYRSVQDYFRIQSHSQGLFTSSGWSVSPLSKHPINATSSSSSTAIRRCRPATSRRPMGRSTVRKVGTTTQTQVYLRCSDGGGVFKARGWRRRVTWRQRRQRRGSTLRERACQRRRRR